MSSVKVPPFRVAVIVGSNRRESTNRALAQALAKLGRAQFAANVVKIDDLPLYSQDLESNLPPGVVRMKAEVATADALLFVTPEHSRSIPAALKNAIDWGARPWGQNSWTGKPAAVTGTSPGGIGTAIAQQHLRQVLGAQGVHLLGGEAYITYKPGLVDGDDNVTDDSTRAFLKAYLEQFAAFVGRFASPSRAAA